MKDRTKIKEYSLSTLKGMIGAIPIAGTFINEVVFEARSRIKQERINSFINSFEKHISNYSLSDDNLKNIDKIDFGDIFEEIIKSVSKTSANHKIEIFKTILSNQFFKKNNQTELTLKFIYITNNISAFQFQILLEYSKISERVAGYKTDIKELRDLSLRTQENINSELELKEMGFETNIELLTKRLRRIKSKLNTRLKALRDTGYYEISNPKNYGLNKQDFLVEIHDLISKGLLIDQAMTYGVKRINSEFRITSLARSYIKYIVNEKNTA